MSDLTQLSDEELLSQLSDDELRALAGGVQQTEQEPTNDMQTAFARMPIMSALGALSSAIDPYTGAPVRAGMSAAIKGENPLTAASAQFGEPSYTAPTGKDISERLGVPENVSPYTGMAVDVLADPTNLIPGKALSGPARAIGKGVQKVSSKVGPKVAEAFTGVPKKSIETFFKDFDRVSKMIKEYGKAPDAAADAIRDGYQNKLQSFRRATNQTLDKVLSGPVGDAKVNITDILSSIDSKISKLNPKLYGSDIADLQDLQRTIMSVGDDTGKVTVREMHDIKQYLDNLASPEWSAQGTKIFPKGDKIAQAAKQAANLARKSVNTAAPEVRAANQSLSALRKVEEKINKNLISSGKSESALKSAGAGANTRARSQLQRLEEITGKDFLSDADALSAFETFRDTPLLPMDTTGKVAGRMGLGYGLGYLAGGVPGAVIGGSLTSPEALKRFIQLYKLGIEPAAEFGARSIEPITRGLSLGRGVGVEENRKKRLKALSNE